MRQDYGKQIFMRCALYIVPLKWTAFTESSRRERWPIIVSFPPHFIRQIVDNMLGHCEPFYFHPFFALPPGVISSFCHGVNRVFSNIHLCDSHLKSLEKNLFKPY